MNGKANYQTALTVRVGDINYGGHLGHDRLITLLHQARIDFFNALGGNELDFFGIGLIMRRLQVDYLAEAFLGEVLTVEMEIVEVKPSRFSIAYRVLNSEKLVATAQTLMVAFDYQLRKVRPLPDEFYAAIGA
ncbi:acyl-CoA thioesterase [Suttonella ornithocola]|uniref:Acyl-CoA thioesterase YbgC n=1 Tax=Suttonella ornithocola TaxID=279832 RepID=A0A380MSY2_9GAMM|nr:thioesterase family protein [Suttonella ornithocola]SUO95398.1 acyl-CoA thioesterase YbgC [Suttonella ornithocola]